MKRIALLFLLILVGGTSYFLLSGKNAPGDRKNGKNTNGSAPIRWGKRVGNSIQNSTE